MKLFEDNKTEDKEIIEAFEMCFQELKDKGFKFIIDPITKNLPVNLSKGQIVSRHDIYFSPNKTPCIYIDIYKRTSFKINDIINYLLFTEDYMKDVFNITLNYIYNDCNNSYYKNIQNLPLDEYTHNLAFFFSKN